MTARPCGHPIAQECRCSPTEHRHPGCGHGVGVCAYGDITADPRVTAPLPLRRTLDPARSTACLLRLHRDCPSPEGTCTCACHHRR